MGDVNLETLVRRDWWGEGMEDVGESWESAGTEFTTYEVSEQGDGKDGGIIAYPGLVRPPHFPLLVRPTAVLLHSA